MDLSSCHVYICIRACPCTCTIPGGEATPLSGGLLIVLRACCGAAVWGLHPPVVALWLLGKPASLLLYASMYASSALSGWMMDVYCRAVLLWQLSQLC
jgi:hypothetical protein